MTGFQVCNADETGIYGVSDDYDEIAELLKVSIQHDPEAHIKPYKYESLSEKVTRLEKEKAELTVTLAALYDEHEKSIKVGHIYALEQKCGRSYYMCLEKGKVNGQYTFMRIKDSWRFSTHGAILKDGILSWNYSTGGYFACDGNPSVG